MKMKALEQLFLEDNIWKNRIFDLQNIKTLTLSCLDPL